MAQKTFDQCIRITILNLNSIEESFKSNQEHRYINLIESIGKSMIHSEFGLQGINSFNFGKQNDIMSIILQEMLMDTIHVLDKIAYYNPYSILNNKSVYFSELDKVYSINVFNIRILKQNVRTVANKIKHNAILKVGKKDFTLFVSIGNDKRSQKVENFINDIKTMIQYTQNYIGRYTRKLKNDLHVYYQQLNAKLKVSFLEGFNKRLNQRSYCTRIRQQQTFLEI